MKCEIIGKVDMKRNVRKKKNSTNRKNKAKNIGRNIDAIGPIRYNKHIVDDNLFVIREHEIKNL